MILRLSSGSVTPASAPKKRSPAFTWMRSTPNWRRNVSSTCSASPDAHQTGVDEDAGELVADGLVDERGGHRRVDATRQRAQHPRAADLGADRRRPCLDDRGVRPASDGPPHTSKQERSSSSWPRCGVGDLGVELHAVDAAARRPPWRRPGASGVEAVTTKPAGTAAMASAWLIQHVGVGVGGQSVEQRRRPRPRRQRRSGRTRRAPVRATVAAELRRQELGAVADAEDRDAEVVDAPGRARVPALGVDRLRTAREDDRPGLASRAPRRRVMSWRTISE